MYKEATGALVAWLSQEKTMDQVMMPFLIENLIEVPDGGDGGDGGDVYFRSSGRLSSLYDLRRAHFYGNDGKYGLVSLIQT
jgi:GTPase involved in cell partitioning and DNA repair